MELTADMLKELQDKKCKELYEWQLADERARVQILAKALQELQVILKPCDGICSAANNANRAFKKVTAALADAGLDKQPVIGGGGVHTGPVPHGGGGGYTGKPYFNCKKEPA